MMERRTSRLERKPQALGDLLSSLGSVIVAYSGGVDSAYLAYAASRTLGDRAVAVTADSPSYPDRHRRLAIDIADGSPSGTRSSRRTKSIDWNTGRIRSTAVISANTSCIRTSRRSPRPGTRSSSTATTPTIAATIARAGRRRASSESAARSTKSISGRTRSASCRGAQACRRGTSRHPPAFRRVFRITPRSRSRSCA